ncbi:MAG: saccharopine dehydrogenase NADP-binding domain-containing protein [Patescibacteria group bacterium]
MSIDETNPQPKNRAERPTCLAGELWFTANGSTPADIHKRLMSGAIAATIRLGDRTSAAADFKGGYVPGRSVRLLVQLPDGSFTPQAHAAVVTAARRLLAGELTDADCVGAALDGDTAVAVKDRLAATYGRPIADDDDLTVVRFALFENMTSAADLMAAGVAHPAEQPTDNPTTLDFEHYTLPCQEHDYPARTPTMWNAAYREFDLPVGNCILLGDPSQARSIFDVLRRDPKYLGGGTGVGFKDVIPPLLDELDPLAEAIGAVNFVRKMPDGKLRGYNTDGRGYAQGLADLLAERGEELSGKKAVLLGAGGTGNAVAFALAERGLVVQIINRTKAKAQVLADKINRYFGTELASADDESVIAAAAASADVVINVSTKGAAGEMADYSALAPASLPATPENIAVNLSVADTVLAQIPSTTIISDVVLTKAGTPLLRAAAERGFTTLDGLPMVINQGVEAFWILHGEELAARGIAKAQVADVMRRAAYAV